MTLDTEKTIAKEAVLALVNISADEEGTAVLLEEVIIAYLLNRQFVN